jgi:hypothetical protein
LGSHIEGHRLRVFDNRVMRKMRENNAQIVQNSDCEFTTGCVNTSVLRKIFGLKRNGVTGDWKKQRIFVPLIKYYPSDQTKKN